MSKGCPIIFRQVDSTISKISAIFVSTGVITYLITMQKFILIFLILDFMVRLSKYKRFSPIFRTSSFIKVFLNLPTHLEDAGAKRLAAIFGLIFTVGILVSGFLGLQYSVWIIAFIFLLCVALDVFLDYCIACVFYSFFKRMYPKGFN
ncbi:MAG TPA: DUF4395 domain-containing protein [Sulfuricurvum sp.]|nr:MAG: hypothetical protein B7Y30_11460 [Campylobacterales bacterium 16-40-21]OZA03716.1 MAG: hypothetical protein B7X89_03335 [Sulfuricurvum sp. 17-40-25]HQS65768.1 DUF4395 domain-containing protein [Sulfuricurvum sp.]HQT37613.1 DUF4395 domain-containing protein [Sulfuricurvum sp.]